MMVVERNRFNIRCRGYNCGIVRTVTVADGGSIYDHASYCPACGRPYPDPLSRGLDFAPAHEALARMR